MKEHNFSKDCIILVVEDNPINRALMEALFEELELEVNFAKNGREGIIKTSELKATGRPPDLILMDIHLPEINGIEATKQIRQQEEFKETPIVALSADTFTELQQEAAEAGMSGFLVKPLRIEKLVEILNEFLPPA